MAENLVHGCDQDHDLYTFEFEEAKENTKFSGSQQQPQQQTHKPVGRSGSDFTPGRPPTTGGSNTGNNYRFPKRNRVLSNESQTFLDRFRSQASTKSLNFSPSRNSCSGPAGRTGRSFSINNRNSSSSNSSSSEFGSGAKPRKWYSFTNLLSRQSLVNILSYPRSRLSVSSTLNSVFIGTSPTGGEESLTPNEEYHPGIFFGQSSSSGGGSGGGGSENNRENNDGVCLSPTLSCVTISGEFPSRINNYPHHHHRQHNVTLIDSTDQELINENNGVYSSSEYANGERSGIYFYNATSSTSSPLPESLRGFSFKRPPSTSANSRTSNSRLSCGEFFPTPPSSVLPGGRGGGGEGSEGIHGPPHLGGACRRSEGGGGGVTRKALGRSLPTLLQAMESANNGQAVSNAGSKPVTTQDVFDLLYQEFALLTGAKSLDDRYIMIFPDRGNFHLLADDDYRRLMIYLTSVPPMQESESGFVLVVDRRNDKWTSVKTTLLRISSFFPGLIHRVLVLRPVGFLQKAISEVSTKLFRTENLRFQLTICNNVSDLLIFIDSSQLTQDFGGLIVYEKVRWVQQRIEVEAFGAALQVLSKDLKTFTDSFHDLEHPNDVLTTEKLIETKTRECSRLMDELSLASDHGETLLGRIKNGSSNSSSNGGGSASNGNHPPTRHTASNSVQLINVISVERFILQIEDTSRLFQEFWAKEKSQLEQCLKLRRFEQEFKELQGTFDVNVKSLNGIPDMGDSVTATDGIISETVHFQQTAQDDIARAIELEMIGRVIVAENPSAVDTVEPKCIELKRMATHFGFVLDEKIQTQKDWRHVQLTVERANKLCAEGMDLLSSQQQSSSSCDNAESTMDCGILLKKIDAFLDIVKNISDELATSNSLSTATTSQSRSLLQQVHKRVEELQGLMSKKRSSLVLQLSKSKFRRNSGSSSTSSTTTPTLGVYPTSELKSARSTSQLDESGKGGELRREGSSVSSGLKSASSSLSLDEGIHGPVVVVTTGNNNGKHAEESLESRMIKRGHVLKELLHTEQTYVNEIGDIISGYRNGAVDPDTKPLLPKQLRRGYDDFNGESKMSILFGNLDEIHDFHCQKFLPDLSNCIENMELVGLCFIQRHTDFLTLYSRYCQLLPASESLRKDIGENHPWFLACRQRLNHKLPLGAYLLKPVQRITKYQLLLKDLLKQSDGCEGYSVLLDALDHMLVILRCVDDGMLQLSIVGYPGKLQDEGPLLLQGSFMLWTENKKDRLRLKGHQRHLFLYQKSILICKKDKDPKSASLYFKTKINLSEIGLTEVLRGSGSSKKFEIWIQGRLKVFILQAESVDSKDMWVQSIKKLLMEQLESLRVTKSISGIGVSSNAASKRHRMMAHNKGVTLNGWRTASAGHRPLRQTSSWVSSDSRPRSRASGDGEGDDDISSDMSHSDDDETFSLTEPPPSTTTKSSSLSSSTQPKYALNPQPSSTYGVGESIENGPKYIALADYNAMSPAEISFKEGDVVILRKTGCAGWWFVSFPSEKVEGIEGWAPSSFLERVDSSASSVSSITISGGGSKSSSSQQSVSTSSTVTPPPAVVKKISEESPDDIMSVLR